MQRFLPRPSILNRTQFCVKPLCLARSYVDHVRGVTRGSLSKASAIGVGSNPPHLPRSKRQKPPISLRSVGKLLNGPTPEWPKYKPKE
ncbi:hypothetical protein RSAG8_00817, partial [Rhizoctonia solani AG-8 WAC10335]